MRSKAADKRGNDKRTALLGMSHGKAQAKLYRLLLFELVRQTGRDTCYQCDKLIETLDEFSIEHKEPWLRAEQPLHAYLDVNNIAFSHRRCNSSAALRYKKSPDERRAVWAALKRKHYTTERRRQKFQTTGW